MDTAQVQVEEILLSEHGIASIDDADFSVMNQADIMKLPRLLLVC